MKWILFVNKIEVEFDSLDDAVGFAEMTNMKQPVIHCRGASKEEIEQLMRAAHSQGLTFHRAN